MTNEEINRLRQMYYDELMIRNKPIPFPKEMLDICHELNDYIEYKKTIPQ